MSNPIQVTAKQEVTITLSMPEQYARWLKSVMQNPLPGDSDPQSNHIRSGFWQALESAGVRL